MSPASGSPTVTSGPVKIIDYISRKPVRATPEEVDAVQVLARRFVEDFGYPKEHIKTHPQHRVRKSPSDDSGTYPVDVAIFKSASQLEDDVYIIAECKKKTRKDGATQLKLYMDMSSAEIGVWFNGKDHLYLRKVLSANGTRKYLPLPNIPRYQQRLEDIGKFLRRDLVPPSNLKAIFADLRNHLAGNATGVTRDEALAREVINILFCKIYDELNTGADEVVQFRAGHDESSSAVKKRLKEIFGRVKVEYDDVFAKRDVISLDAKSVLYIVGELQPYAITEAPRDAIGDAFEVFIGPALRGAEGQFFTPRNVVRMVTTILDPSPNDHIVDPACGSGGFLVTALGHVWERVDKEGKKKKWSASRVERKKWDVATKHFRGIDKDSFLAKVTKAYMAIMGDGRGGVFCENSLQPHSGWSGQAKDKISLATFDLVLTNPPFGKKIKVKGKPLLSQYDLGHKWQKDKKAGSYEKRNEVLDHQVPQLLFLERCVQLLKPGGRLGIVLPESILGNPSYAHVIEWLFREMHLFGVVALPEPLFKTSGKGGTHAKVCVVFARKPDGDTSAPDSIFMAEAAWCGHDSRGNPTVKNHSDGSWELLDDIPLIAERYAELRRGKECSFDHLGFFLDRSAIKNGILVPKYYDPELSRDLKALSGTHEMKTIGEMVNDDLLTIDTGVEVGKMAYGTGPYPFYRTSDIANWELKSDPKHGVSDAIYDQYVKKGSVQAGDILMVRDGTYLIGTTAMVTEYDGSEGKALYQSHLLRFRVTKPDQLDPYLFLAALNAPIVKRQIRSKQFTQDIIDTLGRRVLEVSVPLPKDQKLAKDIAKRTRKVVTTRAKLRRQAREIAVEVSGEEGTADDYTILV